MDKVPSLMEVLDVFRIECGRRHCKNCKYDGCDICAIHYAYDVLTGKMSVKDSFDKEVNHE